MDLGALGDISMKYSMSVTKGIGNQKHNMRLQDRHPVNVDKNRTSDNVVLRNDNMRDVYKSLFDESVRDYNAKQTRSDRKVKDYYSKIANSKKEKLFHELVIQVGNKDEHPSKEMTGEIYRDFLKTFEERNPQMKVVGAYIHNDESTPHMHIDYIPVAKYSRGQALRVANNRAIEQMGYENWEAWKDSQMANLEKICLNYDISRRVMHDNSRHVSVKTYKNMQKLASERLSLQSNINIPMKAEKAVIGLNFKREDVYRAETVNECMLNLENDKKILLAEIDELKNVVDEQNHKIEEMKGKRYLQENDTLRKELRIQKEQNEEIGKVGLKVQQEKMLLSHQLQESNSAIFDLKEELKQTKYELSSRDEFLNEMGLWEVYRRFYLKLDDKLALLKYSMIALKDTYAKLVERVKQRGIGSRIDESKRRVKSEQKTHQHRVHSKDGMSR